MPFKSEAQRRLFHAKAERGEISEQKVKEWEHKTKNKKDLPYHVKKSSSQIADEILSKMGAAPKAGGKKSIFSRLFSRGEKAAPAAPTGPSRREQLIQKYPALAHESYPPTSGDYPYSPWAQAEHGQKPPARMYDINNPLHPFKTQLSAAGSMVRPDVNVRLSAPKSVQTGYGTFNMPPITEAVPMSHTPLEQVKQSASSILDDFLSKTGANLAKGIGVLTAGKGGPKALERVMSAEKPNKPVPPPAANEKIEWRKDNEPKKPVEELLKFFSLKEGMSGSPMGRGFSAGAASPPSIGVGANKSPSMAMVPKGSGVGGLATGNAAAAGGGRTGTAAVDPDILQAALMKANSAPASSKLWQGLTGLSDDVLMAAMNIQKKREKADKHASADEFISSLSMLSKMSEVSKKEVASFFQDNPNPKDEKLHAWAEGKGEEPDDVEAKAYELATAEAKKQSKGDKIEGGKADDKSPSDFDPKQIAMGKKVEKEHTTDPSLAAEIATDHLEEIPDYYTRLKKMEDAAPKKEAGLLQENPFTSSYPISLPAVPELPPAELPPDVIQLLKAQALIDQAKTAQNYDTGDVRVPYPREDESGGVAMPMDDIQEQMFYDQMLAQQMRAQNIEDEFKGKMRRGQIVGGLAGLAGGAGIGHLLGAGGKMHIPAMLLGGGAGGFLGASLGENVGRKQGLEYLQNYTGIPWRMQ